MIFTDEIKTNTQAQENVRDLIAALRSGQYEQTRAYLRTKQGYCCLGVACDRVDNAAWTLYPIGAGYAWKGERFIMKQEVVDAYCFLDHYGSFGLGQSDDVDDDEGRDKDGLLITNLVGMNDGGRSFAQIADKIEQAFNEMLAQG